jgi:hypothetical protein
MSISEAVYTGYKDSKIVVVFFGVAFVDVMQ